MKGRSLSLSIAAGISIALLVWVALRFLWVTRAFVLILFLGVIFGVTLAAGVDRLERFHIRRSIGTLLLFLACITSAALVAWQTAPVLLGQASQIRQRAPEAIDQIEDFLRNRSVAGVTITPERLDSRRVVRQFLSADSERLYGMLFPLVTNSVEAAAACILLLFIAVYVAAEPGVYRDGIAALAPRSHRDRVEELLPRLAAILRQWLVARILAMIAVGLLTAGALWLDGIPGFAALAVIAGVLEFIPVFGPIVSALPAIAMGLLVSPGKALSVALIFIGIQQFEGAVITPLIMRSRIAVPPLVTIAAVTMLGSVFGVAGMMVSEPAAAITIALVLFLRSPKLGDGR